MTEDRLLSALGDPTRRAVFEVLASGGPQPVNAIAARLPVSRPAVSQHLKVLARAGLVSADVQGTRHVYRVEPAGLAALRAWVDWRWEAVLDQFEKAAQRRYETMNAPDSIPQVLKTRVVPLEPAAAFELFTARMSQWWPLATFSVGHERARGIRFEGRVGGRVVELLADGTEYAWADVFAWDPPNRFVLSWHPDPQPVAASTLEVRFRAAEGGTEIILKHRGWEEFGAEGPAMRGSYEGGWDDVLARLEQAAAVQEPRVADSGA